MQTPTKFNETELAILASALQEFSRHGRQGARMQDIADGAGLNKALIHYYFRSKDRLYQEVFTFVFQSYFMQIAEAIRTEDGFEAALRRFIHRYIDLLEENPALPMFMLREVAEGAPVLRQFIAGGGLTVPAAADASDPSRLPSILLGFFEQGVREGAIVESDPLQTLITIMGACIYFFAGFPIFAALIPGLENRRKEIVEERKEQVFELVYYGLKPRSE